MAKVVDDAVKESKSADNSFVQGAPSAGGASSSNRASACVSFARGEAAAPGGISPFSSRNPLAPSTAPSTSVAAPSATRLNLKERSRATPTAVSSDGFNRPSGTVSARVGPPSASDQLKADLIKSLLERSSAEGEELKASLRLALAPSGASCPSAAPSFRASDGFNRSDGFSRAQAPSARTSPAKPTLAVGCVPSTAPAPSSTARAVLQYHESNKYTIKKTETPPDNVRQQV